MQDPLSSIPHQTFQAHRAGQLTTHASLPPKPSLTALPSSAPSAKVNAAATVFAAPQLRDFKKEATAFVPSALKRKKPATGAVSSRINAAPSIGGPAEDANTDGDTGGPVRPDLLGLLKGQFGAAPTPAESGPSAPKKLKLDKGKKKDDSYDKFVEEMGDIL